MLRLPLSFLLLHCLQLLPSFRLFPLTHLSPIPPKSSCFVLPLSCPTSHYFPYFLKLPILHSRAHFLSCPMSRYFLSFPSRLHRLPTLKSLTFRCFLMYLILHFVH